MRSVYSVFAVILPVALGLGLQYLYIMGRLSATETLAIITLAALLIAVVTTLVRVVGSDRDKATGDDTTDE